MSAELSPEQKAAEARDEKKAWGIIVLIVVGLVLGFLTMGLPGVGIVSLALVAVIYVLLVLMAGGKA